MQKTAISFSLCKSWLKKEWNAKKNKFFKCEQTVIFIDGRWFVSPVVSLLNETLSLLVASAHTVLFDQ